MGLDNNKMKINHHDREECAGHKVALPPSNGTTATKYNM